VSVGVVIVEPVVVELRACFGKAWKCLAELDQCIVSLEVWMLLECFLDCTVDVVAGLWMVVAGLWMVVSGTVDLCGVCC
jgi:hypothetical protein